MSSVQTAGSAAQLALGMPGINMPLMAAMFPSLGRLAGEDAQDFPSLQEQTPLFNAKGAPALADRYNSAEDEKWARMDIMFMVPAIDALIGSGYGERMNDSSKSLKARIERNEAMRESANLKRAEEHEKRVESKRKNLWGRIFGLVANVVTTVFLAVAVAASAASGVGLFATPLLAAMLCASVLGVVERSVQFGGNEDFSFTSGLSSLATALLKKIPGVSDEFAEKLGNVIGAALVIASIVGVLNDPSAVGRLVANELKLVGVPDEIADIVDQVMTAGATVAVIAYSYGAAKASTSALGGFSKLASSMRSGVTVKNIAVASDVGGQLVNAGANGLVGMMNGLASDNTREADKVAIQNALLQTEMRRNDRYSAVESDALKRMAASFSDWRDSYVTMLGDHGDVLRRLAGSVTGDAPAGA